MQMTTLLVSLLLMAVIAFAFARAAQAAAQAAPAGGGAAGGGSAAVERRRRALVLGMLALGVVVSLASLWRWPHAVDPAAVSINITGGQWWWEIDRTEAPLGQPVVFTIQTADVSHGAGIMNADGRILAQTQAMPGYLNRFQVTFDEPGTYRVVCLEYCGVAHHDMVNTFTVAVGGN